MSAKTVEAKQESLIPMNGEPRAEIVPAAPAAFTPVELLRMAVSQNADIDKLKQLMDLQERWERNEARKAFEAALTRFKADPPVISKNKHVKYPTRTGSPVDYWHATLDHACEEIIPALSTVGLTHTWKIVQKAELITVICVLRGYGHSEETQMEGPPDTSGDKSPLKAASSTVTVLQRVTLLAACGLAAKNADDETEGVTMGRAADFLTLIREAPSKEELEKYSKEALAAAYKEKDPSAAKVFMEARQRREKELAAA